MTKKMRILGSADSRRRVIAAGVLLTAVVGACRGIDVQAGFKSLGVHANSEGGNGTRGTGGSSVDAHNENPQGGSGKATQNQGSSTLAGAITPDEMFGADPGPSLDWFQEAT
jgi:hypothetical protein